MQQLGFERFSLAGHDRGGRVAYRLALDHPERVEKLAVLDIIPTGEAFRRTDFRFAMGYWHWFFLAQPFDLPERIIGADPEGYFGRRQNDVFTPEARAEYLRHFKNPEVIHAICEDYRAGATFDFQLDEADRTERRSPARSWRSGGAVARCRTGTTCWSLARLGGRRARQGARVGALPGGGGT